MSKPAKEVTKVAHMKLKMPKEAPVPKSIGIQVCPKRNSPRPTAGIIFHPSKATSKNTLASRSVVHKAAILVSPCARMSPLALPFFF
jgi:hypothetical protein